MQDTAIEKTKTFLNPRYVFIPIKRGYRLKVKDGDYIYKNDIVAMNIMGRMIFSSISGKVLGVKDMPYKDGILQPSLVIENDFKENTRIRKSTRKYLTNITREEFLRTLSDTAITHKGINIATLLSKNKDALIINGIDLEQDFKNRYYIIKEWGEDLLETIDLIATHIKAEKVVLALKNNTSDIISNIMNIIGTYPNIEIKLMSDDYASGLDYSIKKNLNMPDALILDVECVYKIYESIKRTTPISEKYISIVGPGVVGSSLIKVKLGSLLSEVFIANFDFALKNVDVYLNGPIGGKLISSMKLVIDDAVDGIYVDEKTEKIETHCINCGLCSKKCPVGLNPKYVFDHKGRVKKEYYNTCISCGLCNYVCPANRDLASYMKGVPK